MFKPSDLFDLSQTAHAAIFDGCEYAWDALKRLKAYLAENLKPGLHNRCEGVAYVGQEVFIGEGTVVEDGAMIKGPAIIGRGCEIRDSYVGTYTGFGGLYCGTKETATITLSLAVTDASPIGGVWTATRVGGTMRVVAPPQGTCTSTRELRYTISVAR